MKAMKTILLSGTVFATSGAFAGIHVDTVTRDIKTKAQEGGTQTMLVQNGMMRTTGTANGSIILKGATITMIDDTRKEYRVMTKEDLKKMADSGAAQMAAMREKMKSMPPEQRAMMEKMMGSKIPGGMGSPDKPDVWESKNMGTTATVEGRKCQVWTLSRNGAPFEELCVVPFNTLAGKEDFQKVFKEMSEAFADLAKNSPNGDMGAKARMAIDGYPVRSRIYASDGKFRPSETVLVKWVEESITASMFEVPAGYKKAEMPKRPY